MFENLEDIIASTFGGNYKKDLVDKVRMFKPTITDGFWGKTTTWEEREKPLTNEELKLMYKVEKKYLE